jgi:Helicase associated domain
LLSFMSWLFTMAVRRSKRKAAEEENDVNGESIVYPEDTPAAVETTMEEEVPADGEAGPPVIKKPRKDLAEAAAKAADEEPPVPTPTEEEIAKTMVQAAVDAPIPVDEAEMTAPATEGATEETATATDPVKMEVGNEPDQPATANPEATEKPEAATTAETPTDDAVKQEEIAAPSNSITAEAVAAMTEVAVPTLTNIYKKETEEYEEPDDGAEIPEETDSVWNAKLLDLLLYKAQYRTLHVQATYDAPLHNWVDIQRRLYRRQRRDPKLVSLVTQTRLTALDAINFPFTLRGSAHWDRYFSKLQEFKTKHGPFKKGNSCSVGLTLLSKSSHASVASCQK